MNTREQLDQLGKRILEASRTELFLSMRFMGSALDSLSYVMDLNTRTAGTDAANIRFNPTFLMQLYIERPRNLNRLYIHMLLHCIFRHMFGSGEHEDAELFDLSADIAVESILDSMEYSAVQTTHSDFRQLWYEKLEGEVGVLTAEKLYKYFTEHPPTYNEFVKLGAEFTKDDHSFWARLEEQQKDDRGRGEPKPDDRGRDEDQQDNADDGDNSANDQKDQQEIRAIKLPKELEEEWKKKADRVKVEIEAYKGQGSDEYGSLLRTLSFVQRRRKGYQHFLKRFAILHEETKVDPDSFDYAYYQYGMELYGNIPLIEENEYRDTKKIRTLVIAIDTSGSCQETLVQRFLNETADILARQESFFRRAEILVIECDDQIQEEVWLKSPDELKRYSDGFHVRGGFGTDFRPVFLRLENLQKEGRLKNLKGLMYFTDGYGNYPERPYPWETAFVLFKDEENGHEMVPDWAYTLYLDENS